MPSQAVDLGAIRGQLNAFAAHIENQLDVFNENGSGWRLARVLSAAVQLTPYRSMKGGSYLPLPQWVANKQACVNVQNKDEECFKWSVLAGIHPQAKDAQRVSKYLAFSGELDMTGITYPVSISQIKRFEDQNPTIAIQVLGIDSEEDGTPMAAFYQIRQTPRRDAVHNIILLLISAVVDGEPKSHYVLVRDFNRLMGCTKAGNQTFNCFHCFFQCTSAARFEEHKKFDCSDSNATRESIPMRRKIAYESMSYVNGRNPTLIEQRAPFIIYADYESILQPIDEMPMHERPKQSESQLFKHKHIAIMACAKVVCSDPCYSLPTMVFEGLGRDGAGIPAKDSLGDAPVASCTAQLLEWTRTDVAQHIKKTVQEKLQDLRPYLYWMKCHKQLKEMYNLEIVDVDRVAAEFVDHGCHICRRFQTKIDVPDYADNFKEEMAAAVVDICPFSKKLHGLGHRQCVRDYRMRLPIPVVFHNLSGYDSHLMLKDLSERDFTELQEGQDSWNNRVSVLAQNEEKVLTYSIGQFRFIDSCKFLNDSLEKLVHTQRESGCKFPITHTEFGENTHLFLQKGHFPYEYLKNEQVLDETRLPPKEAFKSILRGTTGISDEEHAHAQKVWNTMGCNTMRDYCEDYIRSDVNLLADCFEYFRSTSLAETGIDPCHFISLPQYSLHVMRKMTGATIELMPDVDMYRSGERWLRGGMVGVMHRHAEVQSDSSDKLLYLDATNLYGWAMTQALPEGDFKWMNARDVAKYSQPAEILKMGDEAPRGAMFVCDIDIPEHLHDYFSDYPLLPENRFVSSTEMSPKQLELAGVDYDQKARVKKLISDLHPKREYHLHYRMLKFALQQGCILRKVHRILHFKQSAWLKPYIDWCTAKRKELGKTNAFLKDLFKLMANAVFGKMMQGVRDRVEMRMAYDEATLKQHSSDTRFRGSISFNKHVVGCLMRTASAKLNSPIAVGASILDLSKLHMFKFHYETVKPTFAARAKLCYTDTDSLIYRFEHFSDDDLKKLAPHLDMTTMLPKGHQLYSEENQGVLGKFKDECSDYTKKPDEPLTGPMTSFVALRSKMYSYLCTKATVDGTLHGGRKAKGISKQTTKKQLNHEMYVRCVRGEIMSTIEQVRICSIKHQLYTAMDKSKCCYHFSFSIEIDAYELYL